MRPCEHCGHPLQNHQKVCDLCNTQQALALGATNPPSDNSVGRRSLKALLGGFFWFLAELLLRTVVVGIPLSVGLTVIAFFIVWDWNAVLIGTGAGMLLAMGYSLIEMYFEHQVHRGPLK